jgi:hypothetical protein
VFAAAQCRCHTSARLLRQLARPPRCIPQEQAHAEPCVKGGAQEIRKSINPAKSERSVRSRLYPRECHLVGHVFTGNMAPLRDAGLPILIFDLGMVESHPYVQNTQEWGIRGCKIRSLGWVGTFVTCHFCGGHPILGPMNRCPNYEQVPPSRVSVFCSRVMSSCPVSS